MYQFFVTVISILWLVHTSIAMPNLTMRLSKLKAQTDNAIGSHFTNQKLTQNNGTVSTDIKVLRIYRNDGMLFYVS